MHYSISHSNDTSPWDLAVPLTKILGKKLYSFADHGQAPYDSVGHKFRPQKRIAIKVCRVSYRSQ
jgi:hypothetical protein